MVVGNSNNESTEADAKYNLKLNSELYEDGFEVANVAEETTLNSNSMNNSNMMSSNNMGM